LSSKKGRKTAKKVAQVGGLALVGGLAWKAYQNYRNDQQQPTDRQPVHQATTPAGQPSAVPPRIQNHGPGRGMDDIRRQDFEAAVSEPPVVGSRSLLIVRAMISAAMADGHLDAGEQGRLFREIDRLDLSTEEKGMLVDELRHPWSVEQLAAGATDPETTIELYAASVLAIDETRPESRLYLESLAATLELPPMLVESVHIRSSYEKCDIALAEPA
jgi:uncharacterized membrane protein YebE (DUF533 family)